MRERDKQEQKKVNGKESCCRLNEIAMLLYVRLLSLTLSLSTSLRRERGRKKLLLDKENKVDKRILFLSKNICTQKGKRKMFSFFHPTLDTTAAVAAPSPTRVATRKRIPGGALTASSSSDT